MAKPRLPTVFLRLIPLETQRPKKKKAGRQFTGRKTAEQEEAIKQQTKKRQLIERAQREKYAELHAYGKGKITLI